MQAALKLFGRLTEVEKIALRAASPGRLEYLANTAFLSDLPAIPFDERVAIVAEAAALSNLQSSSRAASLEFGQTWLY